MITSSRSLRVMLIEDRTVTAITLECLLEDQGHQVTAFAATAPQADRVLRAAAPNLDVVILDARLLGKPSLQIACQVERLGLPLIVTSTQSECDVQRLGFGASFLPQPFTEQAVATALRSLRLSGEVSAA